MAITEEEAQILGKEESELWQKTYTAIVDEIHRTQTDFHHDRKLARQLTSELVATRREEDKVQLGSDERVAHGLTQLRKNQSESLENLEEQPYFARVITMEEKRDVEFRLGTASFPEQRIIDWRKAPISKLYYDYREGDEFAETIQGQEREGFIQLRRSYHGKKNRLHIIETAQGNLYSQNGAWKVERGSESLSRTGNHDGHLPPILSLITPEQFKLITKDSRKPMLIQGIAGSGKTTVALHRLAWLLHKDNAGLDPTRCLVVMFNRSLKTYIETTLPELNIHGVPIQTFQQWANQLATDIAGPRPTGTFKKSRELEQFKSSAVCLDLLQKYKAQTSEQKTSSPVEDLFCFYTFAADQEIFWPKWEPVRLQLREQVQAKVCEFQDDSVILQLVYAEHGYYPVRNPKNLGLLDHVVVDEAQDFGLMEIRALLNAVDQNRTMTIVGDVAQKIVMGRNFSSWEEMLRDAGFEETTPVMLTVSHRSTKEIMEVASRLRQEPLPANNATRSGPTPSFIRAQVSETIPNYVGQWIQKRTEENPNALSAIICRWPKEAQLLVDQLRQLGHPSVRLGHRDQFEFSPGVVVTNVNQVKGLEFRNVLVVEPSEENYGAAASEEERNLLYVAVTRAESRLDFIGSTSPTKLLPTLMRGNPNE